ncbi:MAG: GNAT family N-acetyltransferase [Desulfobacula sp.]|nr:GNAT family N-acetyltransferase [Desulfobacula sp.]
MIVELKSIDKIKPIFKEYLNYMSQFFEIYDQASWCEGALKNLQRYRVKNDHHIYVLMESEFLIGFAFVNKHLRFNNDGFAIAEFYIQKKYNRKGYGRRLAEHVFAQFIGEWEIAVSLKNNLARKFWKKVLSSYTNDKFMEKKTNSFNGYVLIFNNA